MAGAVPHDCQGGGLGHRILVGALGGEGVVYVCNAADFPVPPDLVSLEAVRISGAVLFLVVLEDDLGDFVGYVAGGSLYQVKAGLRMFFDDIPFLVGQLSFLVQDAGADVFLADVVEEIPHAELQEKRLVLVSDYGVREHGGIYVNIYGVRISIVVVNGELEEVFDGVRLGHQNIDGPDGYVDFLVSLFVELLKDLLGLTRGRTVGDGGFPLGGQRGFKNGEEVGVDKGFPVHDLFFVVVETVRVLGNFRVGFEGKPLVFSEEKRKFLAPMQIQIGWGIGAPGYVAERDGPEPDFFLVVETFIRLERQFFIDGSSSANGLDFLFQSQPSEFSFLPGENMVDDPNHEEMDPLNTKRFKINTFYMSLKPFR